MNQSTPQPPRKNYLRVQSDGTAAGTHVFTPNGCELRPIRLIDIRVEARQAEICELEFYLGEGQPMVFVNGTKEDGVYFGHLGVSDRMDGLVRCEITPVEQDSQGIAKIRFYPAGSMFAREQARPHINGEGKFQSDKYPTCPAGKVPLSTKDKTAQDLLWQYAQRRRAVDAEFADDLETCLVRDGYAPPQRETMVASAAPVSALPALEAKLRAQIAVILNTQSNHAFENTVNWLFELIELGTPSLGCATTGELLEELAARAEMHGYGGSRMMADTVGTLISRLRIHAQQTGYADYRTIDENSSHVAVKGEAAARKPQP